MLYKKLDIVNLVEGFYEKDLISESYDTEIVPAIKFLTHLRFDLAFKLLFLEMLDKHVQFSMNVYQEHIRAFSLGKFTEPGNVEKKSIGKFVDDFDIIFNDIKNNGFDRNKSLIPVSSGDNILNGAHRVASAILLKESIESIKLNRSCPVYDYKFFYERNVSEDILDSVATKFIEHAEDTYIAFIWPSAQGRDGDIEKIITNIVYRKNVQLNFNGAHNLLSQIYYGERWLGSVENNFKGSKRKLLECFKSFGPVRTIAFQAGSLEEVLEAKDRVRDVFNAGKHSIHITDTKQEAIRIARIVFNKNGVAFLNNAKPNTHVSTHRKVDIFKEFLAKNHIRTSDIVLSGDMVLSVYGLRANCDIGYLLSDKVQIAHSINGIKNHDKELTHYDKTKNDLIYDPENHFYFNGLKFVSFEHIYHMKKNRGDRKDVSDRSIMKSLIKKKKLGIYFQKLRQRFYYQKLKAKSNARIILKVLKLYEPIKVIRRLTRK